MPHKYTTSDKRSLFTQALLGPSAASIAPENLDSLTLFDGAAERLSAQDNIAVMLPPMHKRLLSLSNGAIFFNGWLRMMGYGATDVRDAAQWNRALTWKFAWESRAEDYYCFADTAAGTQFAYRLSDLNNVAQPPVFELSATTLEAVDSFGSFRNFVLDRLLDAPDADEGAAELRRCGPISPYQILLHIPPPSLAGEENGGSDPIALDAAEAMILNGDLALQLGINPEQTRIKDLVFYHDDRNRRRIRVVWR